ncbi:MAG: SulP family inorganic anion transporter [Anaerolineae bacterium]
MSRTSSKEYRPLDDTPFNIRDYLPILGWMRHYDRTRTQLTGDLIAGIIVAVMLVPQGMAYALLAGLPPQVGLYASIVPLMIYGVLGTSRTLAVGPVAMVSLLVASGISGLEPGSVADYVLFTVTLAFLIGVMQVGMGVLRLGFIVNFLSHPVLSGFTTAAALVIGFSQAKHILGFNIPRTEHFHEILISIGQGITQTHLPTLFLALTGIGVLLYFKFGLGTHLRQLGLSEALVTPITKTGPLLIVAISIFAVWAFDLTNTGVSLVSDVPAGLPPLTLPSFDPNTLQNLFPIALTITLVGYMESISVAKALASKRRQKVDPNQELIALGASNLGASFTGGYPVAGGFSRSMVNFMAGAQTGMASVITAMLLLLSVIFLTPLFNYLPNAILASIIVVAVASLVDVKTVRHTWHYSKQDFISLLVTFFAVLEVGIEAGIIIGAITSLVLYLWRTSRPHVAILGRIGETEEYRNILRHPTTTDPRIVAMRVDESLYFPNAQYLEQVVLATIADNPEVEHFVLVASAVNFIDVSALDVLENLADALNAVGVTFYMAKVKGPVMDRLRKIGFVDHIGEDKFFLTCHQAYQHIQEVSPTPQLGSQSVARPAWAGSMDSNSI